MGHPPPVDNSCLPANLCRLCWLLSAQTFFMSDQASQSADEAGIISLTLTEVNEGELSNTVRVPASRLLVYDQQLGFTRVRLTGGTVLDVREGTDQIDRLVRAAAARRNLALQ